MELTTLIKYTKYFPIRKKSLLFYAHVYRWQVLLALFTTLLWSKKISISEHIRTYQWDTNIMEVGFLGEANLLHSGCANPCNFPTLGNSTAKFMVVWNYMHAPLLHKNEEEKKIGEHT